MLSAQQAATACLAEYLSFNQCQQLHTHNCSFCWRAKPVCRTGEHTSLLLAVCGPHQLALLHATISSHHYMQLTPSFAQPKSGSCRCAGNQLREALALHCALCVTWRVHAWLVCSVVFAGWRTPSPFCLFGGMNQHGGGGFVGKAIDMLRSPVALSIVCAIPLHTCSVISPSMCSSAVNWCSADCVGVGIYIHHCHFSTVEGLA